jgi:hypothetical protein
MRKNSNRLMPCSEEKMSRGGGKNFPNKKGKEKLRHAESP